MDTRNNLRLLPLIGLSLLASCQTQSPPSPQSVPTTQRVFKVDPELLKPADRVQMNLLDACLSELKARNPNACSTPTGSTISSQK